jgi:hypothetical protein
MQMLRTFITHPDQLYRYIFNVNYEVKATLQLFLHPEDQVLNI